MLNPHGDPVHIALGPIKIYVVLIKFTYLVLSVLVGAPSQATVHILNVTISDLQPPPHLLFGPSSVIVKPCASAYLNIHCK